MYVGGKIGCVHLGNGYACDINDVDDVWFAFANGSSFIFQNVRHVLKLTKSLILVGQLDDGGYHTSFNKQHWKIQKGSLVFWLEEPNLAHCIPFMYAVLLIMLSPLLSN